MLPWFGTLLPLKKYKITQKPLYIFINLMEHMLLLCKMHLLMQREN